MQPHRTTLTAPPAGPLGPVGEDLAVAHLRDDGLTILATNWALRTGEVRGELDVVAVDHRGGVVVVVEVKTRRSLALGGPLAAVTPTKQRRIRGMAAAWLRSSEPPFRTVRFDVVGIVVPRSGVVTLDHVPGAF